MGTNRVFGSVSVLGTAVLCGLVVAPSSGATTEGAASGSERPPDRTTHTGADREADANAAEDHVARASHEIQEILDRTWGDPEREASDRDPWDSVRFFLAYFYRAEEADPRYLRLTFGHSVRFFHDILCVHRREGRGGGCRYGRQGDACTRALASTRALTVDGSAARRLPVEIGQTLRDEKPHTIAVGAGSVVRSVSGQPTGEDTPGGDATIGPACVELAVQIIVWRGPEGVRTHWVGLDDTPADGFAFEVDLAELHLGDTEVVGLVELWLDHRGEVANGFDHILTIESPGGPGDWNRDGVVTRDDIRAFAASSERRLPRADRNGDGHHDQADLIAFMESYTGGG